MKSFLTLLAAGLLTLSATGAQAQNRDLGARRLLLDDGAGGVLTVSYAGPGNSTFIIPPGGATTVQPGVAPNQTLRWDGMQWLTSSVLENDGTDVTIPTGNLTVSAGTITGIGSGLTNLNASNVATGSLDLNRIDVTGAVLNQALTFDGGNVVYGNPAAGSLVVPFSQTESTPSTQLVLTNTDGAAGGAGLFLINNAGNSGTALTGTTTGSGRAIYGRATGAADAIVGETSATGTGIAGNFINSNTANVNPTLRVTNFGTGSGGEFTIDNAATAGTALIAITNGMGHAATVTTTGTGAAASFITNNAANANQTLSSTTNGVGQAGTFQITNGASGASALYAETVGTGAALELTSAIGGIGVQMNSGRFIASYGLVPSGGVIDNALMVVEVQDDGTGAAATATLPAGTNGQIIITATNDADGAIVDGVAQTVNETRHWTFVGGSWKTN